MRRHVLIIFAAILSVIGAENIVAHDFIDELPGKSKTIDDFSYTKVLAQLKELSLHHIEGIWQFPSDGIEIAIMRRDSRDPAVYNMIMLRSPRRSTRPGTIIGMAVRTAKTGVYDARIYTRSHGSTLYAPKKFRLNLSNDDTNLLFEKRKGAFSFNFWRLLPFSLRYSVRRNEPDKSTAGCIRVYPAPLRPYERIYL